MTISDSTPHSPLQHFLNLLETTTTMSRYDGWKGIYLTKIIKEKLDVMTGETILWLIDEEGNIIIKNSILPNSCI